jgi:hypothetical protein
MLSHEDYDIEVFERMTCQPVILCVADMPQITAAERVRLENAYRRGYFQGMSDVDLDADPHDVEHFIDKTLYEWRYKKHNGKFELPPRLRKR